MTRILLSDDPYALEEEGEMDDPLGVQELRRELQEIHDRFPEYSRCVVGPITAPKSPSPPNCSTCGDKMLDDRDGLTGGWLCANGHRAEIVHPSTAPGTEPPRERPEAEKAGRLMVLSALSGAAFIRLIWWLT